MAQQKLSFISYLKNGLIKKLIPASKRRNNWWIVSWYQWRKISRHNIKGKEHERKDQYIWVYKNVNGPIQEGKQNQQKQQTREK